MMLPKWMINHQQWRLKFIATCLLVSTLIFLAPQLIITVVYAGKIYHSVNNINQGKVAILFGARVYGDNQLSPIAAERALGAALLYKEDKVELIFVSGTNSANHEVDELAEFLFNQGVDENHILIDPDGDTTLKTCEHFPEQLKDQTIILVTQSFHLPRALMMCHAKSIDGIGLAIEDLDLINRSGTNFLERLYIKTQRFLRECALTWAYLLGIYR